MKSTVWLFLSFTLFVSSYGQKYEDALSKFATAKSGAKLYIQYDKEYYVAGETVWFKAYFYANERPDGNNNNLFLQLVDGKGKPIIDQRYPVLGAVANGQLHLPDTLSQGNYYVRALTAKMLTGDASDVYQKNLVVLKNGEKIAAPATAPAFVQFFPESGQLIDGILSIVAFKSIDKWGAPVEVSGTLQDESGITIASFKTYHDGIGKMQFVPKAGKKYSAVITTAAGSQTFPLPEVSKSGINLKLMEEKGGKKFQLSRGKGNESLYDSITLVAQINNHVVYENEIAFDGYPSIIGHLITDSIPSGVLQMTVFDKTGKPIAERLSFVNNNEYKDNGDISITKKGLNAKEENIYDINFATPLQRSMSVSVTDYVEHSFVIDNNIISTFLLSDNLTAHIWNPSWYFNNQTDSVKIALDNLLIIQQYKGVDWATIMNGKLPTEAAKEQSFLTLNGKVVDSKTNQPVSGGKLTLLIEAADSTTVSYEVPVDDKGRIALDSLFFNGKSSIYYSYADSKKKIKPALLIPDEDELFFNAFRIPKDFALNSFKMHLEKSGTNKELENRFRYTESTRSNVKELEKVIVESDRKKSPYDAVNEEYTTGVFRSDAKDVIDNINNPVTDKSINAVDFIKNRIQQVELGPGGFVNRKNMSLISGQKWAVGIFLNESQATIGLLQTIRAKDIALVKFFEAGFVGVGSNFPGGAIAVYTKEKMREEQPVDKLEHIDRVGYTITKEFNSPYYSQASANKNIPDYRTTLLWNPNLFMDANSKTAQVKFYNNDFSKRLKITIEGFDAEGKLIHIEKIIGE